MKRAAVHHQAGLTLIEVLVAILIFSFGLLGFVGLQARAIQYSVSAENSNRAALLANEIGSAMLASQTATLAPPVVSAWQARVSDPSSAGLPNGVGTVATVGKVTTVTIKWQAPGATGVNAVNRYVTQVVMP